MEEKKLVIIRKTDGTFVGAFGTVRKAGHMLHGDVVSEQTAVSMLLQILDPGDALTKMNLDVNGERCQCTAAYENGYAGGNSTTFDVLTKHFGFRHLYDKKDQAGDVYYSMYGPDRDKPHMRVERNESNWFACSVSEDEVFAVIADKIMKQ